MIDIWYFSESYCRYLFGCCMKNVCDSDYYSGDDQDDDEVLCLAV